MRNLISHGGMVGGGGHGAFGILGIGGVLLEFKHGLPAVIAPFAECHSLWSGLQILENMDDAAFLGIVMWVAILLMSLVASVWGLLGLIQRWRS